MSVPLQTASTRVFSKYLQHRLVEDELFRADRQTDGRDEAIHRFS